MHNLCEVLQTHVTCRLDTWTSYFSTV